MYKGSNSDQKSQLSEILTEPLNPRGLNFSKPLMSILQYISKKQILPYFLLKNSYLRIT